MAGQVSHGRASRRAFAGSLGAKMAERRGYWREPSGARVTLEEARTAWAVQAYGRLTEVAGHYRAVITYKELAEHVQRASGVHTSVQLRHWIGAVLGKVVAAAHHRGDPPLTALVVHTTDGMVGGGYDAVLTVAGLPLIEGDLDREQHAADSRLTCYRRFAVDLPPDGGSASLAPAFQATVERRAARTAGERPPKVCPSCFLALPANGRCDDCG